MSCFLLLAGRSSGYEVGIPYKLSVARVETCGQAPAKLRTGPTSPRRAERCLQPPSVPRSALWARL